MPGTCVSSEWIFQSGLASICEDRYLPDFTNFWLKMSPFRFWLAGQGKLGGCLIYILQLEKNQVAGVLGVNSAICYIPVN
jgi:hypothetical protein